MKYLIILLALLTGSISFAEAKKAEATKVEAARKPAANKTPFAYKLTNKQNVQFFVNTYRVQIEDPQNCETTAYDYTTCYMWVKKSIGGHSYLTAISDKGVKGLATTCRLGTSGQTDELCVEAQFHPSIPQPQYVDIQVLDYEPKK